MKTLAAFALALAFMGLSAPSHADDAQARPVVIHQTQTRCHPERCVQRRTVVKGTALGSVVSYQRRGYTTNTRNDSRSLPWTHWHIVFQHIA